MARHHRRNHALRTLAVFGVALGAAACGQSDDGPAYPPEQAAAFDAAAAQAWAAVDTLRDTDVLSDGGATSTEVGQMFYDVYTTLGALIEARAGDDAFDAAAAQIQGAAGDATGLAVRTYRREDLAGHVSAFFETFDPFAAAHLPPPPAGAGDASGPEGADVSTDADPS